MKIPTKRLAQAAVLLQMVFALLSIYYAIQSFYKPKDVGEFSMLKNAATDFYALLALIMGIVLLMCTYALLKFKGWSYVVSIILCLLLMLVLDLGYLYSPLLTLTSGNSLSLTSEILPSVILLLLLISFKEYKRVA